MLFRSAVTSRLVGGLGSLVAVRVVAVGVVVTVRVVVAIAVILVSGLVSSLLGGGDTDHAASSNNVLTVVILVVKGHGAAGNIMVAGKVEVTLLLDLTLPL